MQILISIFSESPAIHVNHYLCELNDAIAFVCTSGPVTDSHYHPIIFFFPSHSCLHLFFPFISPFRGFLPFPLVRFSSLPSSPAPRR